RGKESASRSNRANGDDDPKREKKMVMPTDPMLWHKVAAVSGVAALGLGTYGAHMFRPQNPRYKEIWQTASLYHLVHTAALLGAPMTKRPNIVIRRASDNWNCALLWNVLHCGLP
uniref:Uncharacterized protein n=1 Tax=Aegilops tauschii subsp. strangulata TaxID=200361 RepID=A0A453LT10_AEGTS